MKFSCTIHVRVVHAREASTQTQHAQSFFFAHPSLGDPLHITIPTSEIAMFHMFHNDYWARVCFSKDSHVDDVCDKGGDDNGIGVNGILEALSRFSVAKMRTIPSPIIHNQLDDPIDATIGFKFFEIVMHVLDEEDFKATQMEMLNGELDITSLPPLQIHCYLREILDILKDLCNGESDHNLCINILGNPCSDVLEGKALAA